MGLIELLGFVRFRNPHSIGPVIIQCFMLLSASLILAGLFYVCVLVIAISIHHFAFDRDAKKIPSYVKRSIQFDSESENSDVEICSSSSNNIDGKFDVEGNPQDEQDDPDAEITRRKSRQSMVARGVLAKPKKERKSKDEELAMGARRAANLDKFMRHDIDVKNML